MSVVRESVSVRIEGVQGILAVSIEDKGADGMLLWLGADDDSSTYIGVDPADLQAALSFVLGDQ